MTNSRPVAVSVQESVQNNFKKALPQMVYPQEKARESMPNFKPVPQVVYPQKTTALDSLQKVKPAVPQVVYTQKTALQNDMMVHTADECTDVFIWYQDSGHYDLFTCLGVYIYCVAVLSHNSDKLQRMIIMHFLTN